MGSYGIQGFLGLNIGFQGAKFLSCSARGAHHFNLAPQRSGTAESPWSGLDTFPGRLSAEACFLLELREGQAGDWLKEADVHTK